MSKPAALCTWLLLAMASSPASGWGPQSDSLLESLRSGSSSKATKVLNELKQAPLDRDALELLLELWETGGIPHGEVVASTMSHDIVRINVADVLIQAHRNNLVVAPVAEIRSYALDRLSSGFPDTVSQALFVLSSVDNPEDARRIADVALEGESMLLFRSAVLSLVYMCNPEAETMLDEIRPKVGVASRAFMDSSRERKSAGWCG